MRAVVIYLRTSTEEQNPENQLKDCQSINTYGEGEVIQEQQSAFKDKDREKFERIRQDIKMSKVNHLIVWDLDRLHRNRKKLTAFFEYCKVYGCKIHSFRQAWLEQLHKIPEPFNDIMSGLMIQLMGWLAEDESKKKSERVKIAYKNRTKEWGRKPLSKDVKKEILELRKQGLSIREIADSVTYWDKHNNRKFVSRGVVHKTLQEFDTKS